MSSYFNEDTIVALATPPGGALTVVRLSGPEAFLLLDQILLEQGRPRTRVASLRKIYRSSRKKIDESVITLFRAPNSFTGEDVVEFSLHGNAYIAQSLIEELIGLGARAALPGEFSFRAVRSGRMYLSQAEAILDLMEASNEDALDLAMDKLSGIQAKTLMELADDLRAVITRAEAEIDFSDQDISPQSLGDLKKATSLIRIKVEDLEASFNRGIRLQEGVRVALIGAPNAGKSSFFNAILGEERSIVTQTPGTTRDVLREKITLRSAHATASFIFEDTAGLRSTNEAVERIGIERALRSARGADWILWVIDPGQGYIDIWNRLSLNLSSRDQILAIINKVDIYTVLQIEKLKEELRQLGIGIVFEVSAKTGVGVSSFIDAAVDRAGHLVQRQPGEVLITRAEHHAALSRASEHLKRAETAADVSLFAADLRHALVEVAPLIGETLPDDILGRIFSQFCIGK